MPDHQDMPPLAPDEKFDIPRLLEGIEHYRPRRKGWTWRKQVPHQQLGPFEYRETS
jgi:D-ornithine 4,5-aminomutase subunit beta